MANGASGWTGERLAWVGVVSFAVFTLGSLALLINARVQGPGGTTYLYAHFEAAPDSGGAGTAGRVEAGSARHVLVASFGVYGGAAGLRRAVAEFVVVLAGLVLVWRAAGYLQTIALVGLIAWAMHWTFGVGNVMLVSEAWALMGPWWALCVAGLVGAGYLLTERLREWDRERLDRPDERRYENYY